MARILYNTHPLYPTLDMNEPQRKVSRSNSKHDRPPKPDKRKLSSDASKLSDPESESPVTPIEDIPVIIETEKLLNPIVYNTHPLYPTLDMNEPQRKVSRSNSKPDRPPKHDKRKLSSDASKLSDPESESPVTPIEDIPVIIKTEKLVKPIEDIPVILEAEKLVKPIEDIPVTIKTEKLLNPIVYNTHPLYPTLDMNEPQRKVSRSNTKPDRPPKPDKRKLSSDASKLSDPESESPVSPIEDIHVIQINQVRWFYREPDKYWQPFCGSDSVRLEQSYRVYGDYNTGKSVPIAVMGDMYEVDLHTCVLTPIYWEVLSKQTVVTRAWWFEVISDCWYPFDERHQSLLDEIHGNVLQAENSGTILIKDSKSAHLKVQIGDSEVIWQSSTDIRRCKLDLTSRILGFKGNPVKRGYKVLADLFDVLPPIGHIVFVLHGVGQEIEGASIIKCTDSVREIAKTMTEKYFSNRKSYRVEFFPVNWRTQLILDKGLVSRITLTNAKGFRNWLHLSVGDVMYYNSAKFGPEILDSLLMKLNTLYTKFVDRNPEFVSRGKVSIIAHSLGSVVMYDALYSCKPHKQGAKPLDESKRKVIQDELKQLESRVRTLQDELSYNSTMNHLYEIYHTPTCSSRKLAFQVEHFFAIGSPLAIFISLRNLDEYIDSAHKSCQSLLPYDICKRFYNIFHPADPVAYRIEPIVSEIYSQVKPLTIENASFKPSNEAITLAMGPYLPKIPENTTSSTFSRFFSRNSSKQSKQISLETIDNGGYLEDDGSVINNEKLTERLDFALKEGRLELSHLNFLTAQTGYWESKETILFMLLQIFSFEPKPVV